MMQANVEHAARDSWLNEAPHLRTASGRCSLVTLHNVKPSLITEIRRIFPELGLNDVVMGGEWAIINMGRSTGVENWWSCFSFSCFGPWQREHLVLISGICQRGARCNFSPPLRPFELFLQYRDLKKDALHKINLFSYVLGHNKVEFIFFVLTIFIHLFLSAWRQACHGSKS